MWGETIWQRLERERRMKQQHPELDMASPDRVMQVDNFRMQNKGGFISTFSQMAMVLAKHAAEEAQLRKLDQPQDMNVGQPQKRAGVPLGVAQAFPEEAQGRRVYDVAQGGGGGTSGALDVARGPAINQPLLDLPGAPGPIRSAVHEVSRPRTWMEMAIAAPIAGAAESAGIGGRIVSALLTPMGSEAGITRNVIANAGMNLGAKVGADVADRLTPDNAPGVVKVGTGLAGGLIGGGLGLGGVGAGLRGVREATLPRPARISADDMRHIRNVLSDMPDEFKNMEGLNPPNPGFIRLWRGEAKGIPQSGEFRQAAGRWFSTDPEEAFDYAAGRTTDLATELGTMKFVDIPESVYRKAIHDSAQFRASAGEAAVGNTTEVVIPAEWAAKAALPKGEVTVDQFIDTIRRGGVNRVGRPAAFNGIPWADDRTLERITDAIFAPQSSIATRAATGYRDLTKNIPVGAGIKDISGGLPEDLNAGAAPSFQDALDGLRNAVRTEARLRNKGVVEEEIKAGRRRQFGGVRNAVEQGMERGLSGEELARQARSGAATGGLRRTIAEPVQVSQAQRDALFDEVLTRVADPKEDAALYLTTTRALQKALDGDGLMPHEIRALQPLLGHDMATALAGRAPEIMKTGSKPLSEGGSASIKSTNEDFYNVLKSSTAPRMPDTTIKPQTRGSISDPLRDPRGAEQARVSGIKEEAKSREAEALKRFGPSEEALMQKTRDLLSTEERTLGLRGSTGTGINREFTGPKVKAMRPDIEETLQRWLDGNRDILDSMGPEGMPLIANINAQITGNVADSFLTAGLSRRNILAAALRQTWGDVPDQAKAVERDRIISKVTDALFRRELKIHYGKEIPERVNQILATTRPLPYQESLGAIAVFSQRAKNTMFGLLDVGVFGVQGLNAVRHGSIPMFASLINRGLAASHMPNVALEYADSVLPKQIQYALDGVEQGAVTGAFSRKQGAREVGSLFQYLGKPGRMIDAPYMAAADKMSQWQFGSVLGGIRNSVYEGNLIMSHLLGQDITNAAVRRTAADSANAIGSFAETALRKSRAQKEGVALLSAPMTRARVKQIAQMARVFSPKATSTERIVGAMAIASTVGYTLAVGKLLNDYIGVGDFEFDPGKPGFGTITTATGRVIDVIPQDSVERAFVKSIEAMKDADPVEAARAWGNVAIGSAGPALRVAAGAFGVGYEQGRGYRYGDMGGDLGGRVLNLAPIPPVVSSLANEGFNALGTGLQEVGVNNYPESAYAKAARVYEQETGKDWKSATRPEQAAFKEQHPDIASALEQSQIDQGGGKGDVAQMRKDFREAQERDDAAVQSGSMDWDTWKDKKAHRADQLLGASSVAFGDEAISKPKDAFERWLNEVRTLRGDDGVVSREEWDRLDEWVAQQEAPDQQFIADSTGLYGTALEKERRAVADKLDDEGYFGIRDKVWAKIAQREEGLRQYKTFDDFQKDLSRKVTERLAARGVTGVAAQIVTQDILSNFPVVNLWSQVSNDVEQAWIMGNPKLTGDAIKYGLIKPDSLRNEEIGAIMAASRQ